MKKGFKFLFLFLGVLTLGLVLVACGKHEHTFASEWTFNASEHWHKATCEHTDEVSDKASHTFGGWQVRTAPTETSEGVEYRKCSVCSYEETRSVEKTPHAHTFADTWSSNETKHWHASTCGHADVVSDEADHTWGDWTVVTEAGYLTKGSRKHTCAVCGKEVTEEIPARTYMTSAEFKTNVIDTLNVSSGKVSLSFTEGSYSGSGYGLFKNNVLDVFDGETHSYFFIKEEHLYGLKLENGTDDIYLQKDLTGEDSLLANTLINGIEVSAVVKYLSSSYESTDDIVTMFEADKVTFTWNAEKSQYDITRTGGPATVAAADELVRAHEISELQKVAFLFNSVKLTENGVTFTASYPDENYSFVMTFAANNSDVALPEKIYSAEWSKDEEGHFHAPLFDEGEAKHNLAAHTYGDMIVDTQPYIDAEGHDVDGVGHKVCSVCGYELKNQPVAHPDHEHTWGDWTLVKPTATELGSYTRVCTKSAAHVDSISLPVLTSSEYEVTYVAPAQDKSICLAKYSIVGKDCDGNNVTIIFYVEYEHECTFEYMYESGGKGTYKHNTCTHCGHTYDEAVTPLTVATVTEDSGFIAIAGTISKITPKTEQNTNYSITIVDNLGDSNSFIVFKYVEGGTYEYAVGDYIVAAGTVTKYDNKLELAEGCKIIHANHEYYELTSNNDNVTITLDNTTKFPVSGSNVLFTVAPKDNNYEVRIVRVNGKEVQATNGKYQVMCNGNLVVDVKLRKTNAVVSYVKATEEAYLYDGALVYLVSKVSDTYYAAQSRYVKPNETTEQNYLGADEVTVSGNTMTPVSTSYAFELEQTTGGWYIRYKDIYMNLGSSALSFGNTPTVWSITFDVDGNCVLTAKDNLTEAVRFRSDLDPKRFTKYGKNNYNSIQLYVYAEDFASTKKTAKAATCEEIGYAVDCFEIGSDYYSDPFGFNKLAKADVEIQALGHNWGDSPASWTWEVGYVGATAEFICLNDGSHTETVNVNSVFENNIYTVTVTGPDGKEYSDTRTEGQVVNYSVTLVYDNTKLGVTYNVSDLASVQENTNLEITVAELTGYKLYSIVDDRNRSYELDTNSKFSVIVNRNITITLIARTLSSVTMNTTRIKNRETLSNDGDNENALKLGLNPAIFTVNATNTKKYEALELFGAETNKDGGEITISSTEAIIVSVSLTFQTGTDYYVQQVQLTVGDAVTNIDNSDAVIINSNSFKLTNVTTEKKTNNNSKCKDVYITSCIIKYILVDESKKFDLLESEIKNNIVSEILNTGVTSFTKNLTNNTISTSKKYTVTSGTAVPSLVGENEAVVISGQDITISQQYRDKNTSIKFTSNYYGITKEETIEFVIGKISLSNLASNAAKLVETSYNKATTDAIVMPEGVIVEIIDNEDSNKASGSAYVSIPTTKDSISIQDNTSNDDLYVTFKFTASRDDESVATTTKEVKIEHQVAHKNKDTLDNAFTGVSGTTYTAWSSKTVTGGSGAIFAGNSAGGNSSIQLRSSNNAGIIMTASHYKNTGDNPKYRIASIKITWNSNTAAGRTVDIYGKNAAYSATSDLFGDSTKGTSIASVNIDDANENVSIITVTGDYSYIGIRSKSGALYIDSIEIVWEEISNQ